MLPMVNRIPIKRYGVLFVSVGLSQTSSQMAAASIHDQLAGVFVEKVAPERI